jgi:hypothetical protein
LEALTRESRLEKEKREREREKINQSEPTGGKKAYPLGYFSNCNPLCACWGVIVFGIIVSILFLF